MTHRVLVGVSFVCCTLLIASFAFFATDQVSGASKHQVAELSGTPTKAGATHHGQPRRFIDAAARQLIYPFHSLAQGDSQWADRILLLVCGLALYGLGLGYLARYASGVPLRR